jgi:hypothetical protein
MAMIGSDRDGAVIGRDGVIAVACSLGVVTFGLMRLTSPRAEASTMVLMLLWALAGVLILSLCRLPMPAAIRTPLVAGLVGVSIALGATADLFGARAVGARAFDDLPADGGAVAATVADRPHDVGTTTPAASASGSVRVGARVAMAAAPGGDGGWAETINEGLDGRLGGAAAGGFAIDGDVTGNADPPAQRKLRVVWSIAAGGATERCGVTTVNGAAAEASRAILVDRLAVSFGQAITRSLSLGRAACA